MLALSKGSPCPACVRKWTEFLRELDPGDVGITIYRYKGAARDEMVRCDKTGETIIFFTTKKATEPCEEMGLDMITAKYPKCVSYCPRCMEMMRRLETLFKNSPSALDTDFCELFSCPPCSDIAHKFIKFTTEDFKIQEQDSELIHLQRLTTPGDEDAFGKSQMIFEDLVKDGASQQDGEQTKKDEAGGTQKDKDRKKKDKDLKKKDEAGGTQKDKDLKKKDEAGGTQKDKDLKKKDEAGGTQKDKDRKKKDEAGGKQKDKDRKKKDEAGRTQKDKDLKKEDEAGGTQKAKDPKKNVPHVKDKGKGLKKESNMSMKGTAPDKEPKAKSETFKDKEQAKNVDKAVKKTDDSGIPSQFIKQLISETQKKQVPQKQLTQSNLAKKLLQEAGDITDKTKRAREQVEAARMRLNEALKLAGPQTEESAASSDDRTDVCSDETADDHIIIGERIQRIYKASKEEQEEKPVAKTLVTTAFKKVSPPLTTVCPEMSPPPTTSFTTDVTTPPKKHHQGQKESMYSVVNYTLSDRKYIENGWTQLPEEMVMRRVAIFHMYPPSNNFDWLEMNRHKGRVLYDSGEQLATFEEDRRARIYYRSGLTALDSYQAEDTLAGGNRVVVYGNGNPLERRALPTPTVLAVFDYSGNGVVFDHTGEPRLKYTQNEGVVLDPSIGPFTHWKWHNLNHSGRLQTVMVDNEPILKDQEIIRLAEQHDRDKSRSRGTGDETARKGTQDKSSTKGVSGSTSSPDKSSNKAVRSEKKNRENKLPVIPEQGTVVSLPNDETLMCDIEWKNVVKEANSKRFLPYEIKMKAFKINENFSLRIIDQSSVYLTFTDGKTRFKLNVGMIMDPTMVLGEEFIAIGDMPSGIEKRPASQSMEQLQRVVKGTRAAARARILREKSRLYPPVTALSDPALVKDEHRTT